jgi:hypothetical protein
MLFKKLFQVLVLGGAVVGTTSGCTQSAQAQTPTKGKMADAGMMAADAGSKMGGGVKGW